MSKTVRLILLLAACFLLTVLVLVAQARPQDHSQMQMPGMDHAPQSDAKEMGATMQAMSARRTDMGPHMKMTELRPLRPGDQERADQIVTQLRSSIAKYQDYRVALADGYKIFMPNVKTPMKHFTNWSYAFEALFRFNPEHPTSLLYEPDGNGYKLIGAMYTAPKRFAEDDLDKRVPLSVAQWHEHVNLCAPPGGRQAGMLRRNARFGLAGSISTREECEAAGGKFYPVVFNWMVHVYPFEKDPQQVWSLERQMPGHHHHQD